MYDCIVVGGGLIGMLTARQLTLDGRRVLVIDRGSLGGEASWAGGGILSPLYPWRYPDPVSVLATYSQQHYAQLADSLITESGVDPEWTRSGLLMTDCDECDAAREWGRRFQVEVECPDSQQQIREIEPGLAIAAEQAVWLPGIAQLRNPRLVRAARGSLEHYQVDIAENEPVIEILQQGGRVSGVRTGQRRIDGNQVIICAGAWSAALLAETGISLDVEPVRGQMLVFKARPGIVRHIILHQGHYLIPRRDGRVLIGSTLEYVGFDKSVTESAREQLYRQAIELVPDLAEFEVEKHWSGLRPGTHYGIPYIGEHPQLGGLFFNAGHFRNGVVLGLASVRCLSDIINQRPPEIDATPYRLDADH